MSAADVRPLLCEFLENVLFQLTSETGRTWLHTNRKYKQLPLNIISAIQTIITHLVLAASDEDNHPNPDDPEETKSILDERDRNLAMARRLMTLFEIDLIKAILQKKLNGFDEITPIYRQEYPDARPSTATGGVPLRKVRLLPKRQQKRQR